MERKYGVKYSRQGMTFWLHAHGFSYKQPKGSPAKADVKKQALFIEFYNELMKTTPDDEILLVMDEAGWHRSKKSQYSQHH